MQKPLLLILWLATSVSATVFGAALDLVNSRVTQHVLAGGEREVTLHWRNSGQTTVTSEIHCTLFQVTSATAVPSARFMWKTLSVLPGQTIIESAPVPLPDLRAETTFVLRWVDTNQTLLGTTKLRAYPTNLLHELRSIAPIGIYDPADQLKPLFQLNAIEIVDLLEHGGFTGKLAIATPLGADQAAAQARSRLKDLASQGVAVLSFRSPELRPSQPPLPSYSLVRQGDTAIVLASFPSLENLPADPQAQVELLRLVRLALNPDSLHVPEL